MECDPQLDRPGAGDAGPGPRWFSLLPPIADARAEADEKRRCVPRLWTAVRIWAAAGRRVDEAA